MTPPRKRNQRGEGARLKEEIIQAAMRFLDRAPAAELSLRMAAKEAGVAAPSVYTHFRDVKTMMAEIVRNCWLELGGEMTEAAAGCGGDALAKLQAVMSAYVRYAMERPSRYQLLFALQPVETEALRHLPGLVQPAYRNVIQWVEAFASQGNVLPTNSAIDATMLLLSIAHGRVALARTAPHHPGNSPALVQAFVVDMVDRIFGVE